jgi:hypothetical protein
LPHESEPNDEWNAEVRSHDTRPNSATHEWGAGS